MLTRRVIRIDWFLDMSSAPLVKHWGLFYKYVNFGLEQSKNSLDLVIYKS